jgi:hypothetical protein
MQLEVWNRNATQNQGSWKELKLEIENFTLLYKTKLYTQNPTFLDLNPPLTFKKYEKWDKNSDMKFCWKHTQLCH